jgi:hypothetical protein
LCAAAGQEAALDDDLRAAPRRLVMLILPFNVTIKLI